MSDIDVVVPILQLHRIGPTALITVPDGREPMGEFGFGAPHGLSRIGWAPISIRMIRYGGIRSSVPSLNNGVRGSWLTLTYRYPSAAIAKVSGHSSFLACSTVVHCPAESRRSTAPCS